MNNSLYDKKALRSAIIESILTMAQTEGVTQTPLHNVALFRANTSYPSHPLIYDQSLCMVFQGKKRCQIGDTTLEYGDEHVLLVPNILPVHASVITEGTAPALALTIAIDHQMVQENLGTTHNTHRATTDTNSEIPNIYIEAVTTELLDAVYRLLQSLKNKEEAEILGKQAVKEIIFRLLQGSNGHILAAAAHEESYYAKISSVLRLLHTDYAEPVEVPELANSVNMSVRNFHKYFKQITSYTPIQYCKRIRLEKARHMLTMQGHQVNEAAHLVGYESTSQFSREFKRHFGVSPKQAYAPFSKPL